MGDSSDHNNDDHNNNNAKQQRQEEQDQEGLLCKLPKINTKSIIKVQSCDDHHEDDHMMKIDGEDEEEEGFKTPTKKEQRIKVDLTCPPPAPMKPKVQPMKRRRPSRRNLFQVSAQDFDLIFTPRSSSSSSVLNKDGDHKHLVDSPNKVNHQQPNLTTVMSFR